MRKTPAITARMDAAGRPTLHRGRQALISLGFIAGWVSLVSGLFFFAKPFGPATTAWALFGICLVTWALTEHVGTQRGLLWPASALAIVGSLSLGFALSMSDPGTRAAPPATAIAMISGAAALSMTAYLVRFRLPGLVSPIMTFSIVSLFLLLYGVDSDSLARVEGFSPRGILAALMGSPGWMAVFGLLGVSGVFGARWLDLNGDVFGVASARPLHIVGAGVTALVAGRLIALLPLPLDAILLTTLAVAAFFWALRINRVAVLIAIHFAIAKPLMITITAPLGISLSLTEWSALLTLVLVADLVLWPFVHHISLQRGWTLGPGGRIPQVREGWLWRYWPYA